MPDDFGDYDKRKEWEHVLCERAGLTKPQYEVSWDCLTQAQRQAVWDANDKRREFVKTKPTFGPWGAKYDYPDTHFVGIVLCEGDWDRPEPVTTTSPPADADAQILELCKWLGIEPQPCALWLLSSYG